MGLTARIKRRFLYALLALVFCVLAFLGVTWYLIHYRFKESLQYLVTKESKGRFAFEAGEADLSLWKGTITMKDAHLYCHDTTGAPLTCDARIPELYFSLGSWRALLIDKKLMVDSLAILSPFIDIHLRKQPAKTPTTALQPRDLVSFMDSIAQHLNIRSFALKNASFSLQTATSAEPLHGDHIDLTLRESHIFTISLGAQHWIRPEDKQQLDFSRLTFDSRLQQFELDSFSFSQKNEEGKDLFRLSADRFYFNSRHLSAIYEKDQLLLDTLVCINPLLLEPAEPRKEQTPDSIAHHIRQPLFGYIDVRYVDIIDGRLLVRNKDGGNASTRKANLSIYGLRIDRSRSFPVSTDSIRLSLKNIEFVTRDSLYKLSIEEFGIKGNDVLFRQVRYGPTTATAEKSVVFTAPALLLKDVSIIELLRKHIHASGAELLRPRVMMVDNTQKDSSRTRQRQTANRQKEALFYHTLHNLQELIDAPYLDITEGSVQYHHAGPIESSATGLNAHILLNKILLSDNLLDIKHAIPDWRIGRFELSANGLHLAVDRYQLAGTRRQTLGAAFAVTTGNGWRLEGKNFFWDLVDWDSLQKTGHIKIDSVHVDELTLHGPNGSLELTAAPFHITHLRTFNNYFTWEQIAATLHDIHWKNGQTNLSIQQVDINSEKGATATGTAISYNLPKGVLRLSAPLISISTSIHSSQKTSLPELTATIPNAQYSFSTQLKKDSLHVNGQLTLSATGIKIFPALNASIALSVQNTALDYHTDSNKLTIEHLSGSFRTNDVSQLKKSPDWRSMLDHTTITKAAANYTTPHLTAIAECVWNPATQSLHLSDFSLLPHLNRETYLQQSKWQTDYITIRGRSLILSNPRTNGSQQHIQKITLDGITLDAARDKHIPFHHGIEKLMPTRLLRTIPIDLTIDTVAIANTTVTYNELSIKTNRWSSIAIENITGNINHLDSRSGPGNNSSTTRDTLTIDATARLFDGHIRRFHYGESYDDSLSSFTARTAISALDLTRFSAISIPAAAISVTDGHIDTAWSAWQGNKYAAYGTLNLYYDRLKVRVLNKKDSIHRGFVPTLETWAVHLLLPTRSRRRAIIFFERDREKFVFNYWVKSQTSGIISTVIRKKSDTYTKTYAGKYQLYSLPADGILTLPK